MMAKPSLDINMAKLGDDIWLETNEKIKAEAAIMRDKLHQVREKYRVACRNPTSVKESNKSMIHWNEDLLAFCKANRRKYKMEDRTQKLDRQRLQDQMIIAQYEEEKEKLQKELKEATEAKEKALNRLSELQSHLLKHGNPEITDLSDQNRPTNLGENFRELYDNEWTDAFEYLTEENGTCRKDEEAIEILYSLLKRCSELCSEVLRGQHTALAELVSSPPYLKKKILVPQQKPTVPPKQTQNVTKIDVTVKSAHQMSSSSNSQQSNPTFSKTLPVKRPSSGDQATGPRGLFDKQGENKGSSGNKNTQPHVAKPAQRTDVYEAGQMPVATKPEAGIQEISAKVDMPIKEFSKSVAVEVLKNIAISDILQALNKQKQFQEDLLQNAGIQIYLEKCFNLCWLMQSQHPPMLMDFETKPGTAFGTQVFEAYTKTGRTIAFIVWPPVYLHKDGPLVCKGYAEGKKE